MLLALLLSNNLTSLNKEENLYINNILHLEFIYQQLKLLYVQLFQLSKLALVYIENLKEFSIKNIS